MEREKVRNKMIILVKKALAVFVILMILGTLISRSADSFTIPKVKTASITRSSLNPNIRGEGFIQENAVNHVKVEDSMQIEDIFCTVGEKVEKGEPIFAYDMQSLKDKYEDVKIESNKAKTELEKAILSSKMLTPKTTLESAEIAKIRAELDYDFAKEEEKKIDKLGKKQKKDIKKEILEKKQAAVNEARLIFDTKKKEQENNVTIAKRNLEDAENALQDTRSNRTKMEEALNAYKDCVLANDQIALSKANNNLFILYYGSEEEYQNHLTELRELEAAYDLKEKSLSAIKKKWDKIVKKALDNLQKYSSPDPNYQVALDNYEEQERLKEEAVGAANIERDAAYNAYNKLKKKDVEINQALYDYRNALSYGTKENLNNKYNSVINLLSPIQKKDKEAEDKARLALSRMSEDYNNSLLIQKKVMDEALATVNRAEADLKEVNNERYDYTKEFDSIDVSIKTTKNDVTNKKRALEDAKRALDKERDSKHIAEYNDNITDQKEALDQQELQVNVEIKEKKVAFYRELVEAGGIIKAPSDGIVIALELKKGSITSGGEKVVLSVEGCQFIGELSKEQAKQVEVGDEVAIQIRSDEETLKGEVEGFEYIKSSNKNQFFVNLPEGDYCIGQSASYHIGKNTQMYSACISIDAIREDPRGKYVLVTETKESILGDVVILRKVEITLLNRDSSLAAIQGNLVENDAIVIHSNKSVKEGDRVRLEY